MSKNKVEEIEAFDMDELLGTTASVTIAATDESKNSVLSREDIDTSFLDNPPPAGGTDEDPNSDDDRGDQETAEEKAERIKLEQERQDQADLDDAIGDPGRNNDDDDEGDDDLASPATAKNKGGRKGALIEVLGKLVEKKTLDLFTDQPDIESYTIDDIEELIEQNIKAKVDKTAQEAPLEIFGSLDKKLQEVISYSLKGGTDINSLLKNVARSQEVSKLSLENEEDQERIVREHLMSIDYGDAATIEEEITSIIDRGELEKKATIFKPKLDAKQDIILEKKLKEQDQKLKDAEEASKKYAETIFKTLDNPTLNGLPLNEKEQTMLYYGLVDDKQHQDRNGNPTNAIGHLLERYQFGEHADPSVLAEVLLLMANPQAYRDKVIALGAKKQNSRTLRSIKTAEGERQTSSNKGNGAKAPVSRSAPRRRKPGQSMFSR